MDERHLFHRQVKSRTKTSQEKNKEQPVEIDTATWGGGGSRKRKNLAASSIIAAEAE